MYKSLNSIFGFLAAIILAVAVPAAAQTGATWTKAADIERGQAGSIRGTIQGIDSARSSFRLLADGETTDIRVKAITDAVSTQFVGFGATAEVLRGTKGFGQMRDGDRVQIRGLGAPDAAMSVTHVTLLGRPVSEAVATPALIQAQPGTIEGVIRKVSAADGRIVIETDLRQTTTVIGRTTTPVYWQDDVYRIANLEVGDRIRVEVESTTDAGVRARSIDVLKSVRQPTAGVAGRTVGSVVGRVTRVDTRTATFRVSRAGQPELRVDAANAFDENRRAFRLSTLRNGDIVQVSGEYESNGTLRANTIRFADESDLDRGQVVDEIDVVDVGDDDDVDNGGYETMLVYGVVVESLRGSNLLRVRESNEGEIEVRVLDEFVVRQKSGGYITADRLKAGDRLAIQAFRNEDGDYVAQTIRIR